MARTGLEEKCVALTSFTAMRPDELSFEKGAVITVVAKGKDSGWWEGMIEQRRGLFPNCFVSSNMHPDRAPTFCNKAVALFAYTPKSASELTFAKHDLITAIRPGASAGWWYGVNETQLGKGSERPEPKLFPSNYVTCNIVRATYSFQGRQRCELSLDVGDVVLVHRRWNDGWWEGSLPVAKAATATGQPDNNRSIIVGGMRRGIFPSNYTEPNVGTTVPALFCPRCRTVFAPKATECKECVRNEEIVRTMQETLDDAARGHLSQVDGSRGEVDMFMHVDLEPTKGGGALLTGTDVSNATTVRPRLAM